METLAKVEQLKAELDSLRALEAEAEARIWQKLRLDWNYHSNKLEGNTYSFGETKMLLLKGLTAGGKPVRDHEEISGHDEAINVIIDYIKQDQPLTEIFIRQLHKLILVRPFWADAKKSDGKPTKKLIKVGEYKTEPNHVETQTGAIFYFAEPIETPAKMQELIEWFRSETASPETNAILLAAEFHYRFVRIHPFDDGNGRLARLLMNFVLMKHGFPPVIIKNEDKDNYIAVLEQADFSILEPFTEYIAQNLSHSIEMMIKGALGEDIEEPDDFDKELILLESKLSPKLKAIDVVKSSESMLEVFRSTITPLIAEFVRVSKKFDRFYSEADFRIFVTHIKGSSALIIAGDEILSDLENSFERYLSQVILAYAHKGLNKNDVFDYTSLIYVDFGKKTYTFTYEGKTVYEKTYSEDLSHKEIAKLVKDIGSAHKQHIENKIEEFEKLSMKS